VFASDVVATGRADPNSRIGPCDRQHQEGVSEALRVVAHYRDTCVTPRDRIVGALAGEDAVRAAGPRSGSKMTADRDHLVVQALSARAPR
jgi:hypothetical protein